MLYAVCIIKIIVSFLPYTEKKTHPQTSQLGNGNRFSKKCVGLSARVLCENHHVDTDIDDNPLP